MLNTSVTHLSSSIFPFDFDVCLNVVYGGIVVGFIAMTLCFILGTPTNSWHLWLYLHNTGKKIKPSQVFSLNLTILELIFSAQCAFQIINLLINNHILWKVIYFIACSSWVGRPSMQVCICIEQYMAVLHPTTFLKYKSIHYRIAAAAIVWLMAAVYSVYQNTYSVSFPNLMFNIVFFISVIIISFCCVSVLRALKHGGPRDTQIPVERGKAVGNQQKRKAFNTIFSGLLIIQFTYLPQVSLSLINISNINKVLFHCNILPTINTLNAFSVMITTLLKMHKRIVLKQLKYKRKDKDF